MELEATDIGQHVQAIVNSNEQGFILDLTGRNILAKDKYGFRFGSNLEKLSGKR